MVTLEIYIKILKKHLKKKSNYFIIKQTAKLGYKEFLIIRLYR